MSAINLLRANIQRLLSLIDAPDQTKYVAELKKSDIPLRYATNMGRLLLSAELNALHSAGLDAVDYDFDEICEHKNDLRCQVGQIISHLKGGNSAFLNNVFATVLIVDKSRLSMTDSATPGKLLLGSLECREGLDLTQYGALPDELLCDGYFYANEHIPETTILGSGHFIAHDKIVTAAHVLERALKVNTAPGDLMFIRAHYVYGKKKFIEVWKQQLYVLHQKEIFENEPVINGDEGDLAWVRVEPLYDLRDRKDQPVYGGQLNGVSPTLPEGNQPPVYGLGHGLGIPMKLSFDGYIAGIRKNTSMFYCDMNILPGSSGSPVFDSETHKLVGVVSGLHEIHTEHGHDCATIEIDMRGPLSGVVTSMVPLLDVIKKP